MEWLISRKQLLSEWLQWFILLIAGMLVGIFLNTLTHSTSVYAVDAEWSGHNLIKRLNNLTYPIIRLFMLMKIRIKKKPRLFISHQAKYLH